MTERPFIIGITGNIATGKSVIQRMLANSGALGIDADIIAHRMLYPQGAGFQPVIDAFGTHILTAEREISREKLGEIVFNNPIQLEKLETILHPLVIEAIGKRVTAAQCPLVVIEAIKLIESGLSKSCDQVWVSHVSADLQLQRLVTHRQMPEGQARDRINLQPSQTTKLSLADVVINTKGTFKDIWEQTQRALNDTIRLKNKLDHWYLKKSPVRHFATLNQYNDSQLEAFWKALTNKNESILYELLGAKHIVPVTNNDQISAFVTWSGWNFTGILEEIYPSQYPHTQPEQVLATFEEDALRAQSELLLIYNDIAHVIKPTLMTYGFTQRLNLIQSYPAWQQALRSFRVETQDLAWTKLLHQPWEIPGDIIFE